MSKLFDYIVSNNSEAALALIPTLSKNQLEQRYTLGEFVSCTALHIAALLGFNQIVRSLIEQGANVQARDKSNRLPIHYAAIACEEAEPYQKLNVMRHLHHAESYLIYDIDNNGDTPLHVAATSGEYDWVKYLLDIGSSAEMTNKKGLKPIDLAPTEDERLLRLLKMRESSLQVTILRKLKNVVNFPTDQTAAEKLWKQFLETTPDHLVSQYLVLDEPSPRLSVWCFNRAREAECMQAEFQQTTETTVVEGVTEKLSTLSII